MTITVRDGGLTSTNIHTQDTPDGHIPFHNVLGSVGVTSGTISLLRETAPLGSVGISGGTISLAAGGTVALLRETSPLGSVGVSGGTVALLRETSPLGSVNISGGTVNVVPSAVQRVQFGLSSVVTGQRTMAASIPVTLASDQPNISVNATVSGGGSVNVLGGSLRLATGTAVAGSFHISGGRLQILAGTALMGSVNLAGPVTVVPGDAQVTMAGLEVVQIIPVGFGLSSATMGQKTMSQSVPVTLASDQPSITVTASLSGGGSVNVLGGTVALLRSNTPLGSVGVSGGSIQIIGPVPVHPVQFGLSSATLGQKTMAASIPVTLASDQPSIVVTATVAGGGSVVVLGGSLSIVAGTASMGSVNIGAQPVRTRSVGRTYRSVGRLASNFGLGSTGALGDYLSHVNVIVSQAANSQVTLTDSGVVGGAIIIFPNAPGPGIGTYTVPWDAVSRHGQYRLSLASGVDVVAVGDFT